MSLISFRPYAEGSAVICGFLLGIIVGALAANLALGVVLGVGVGAVIDGLIRIRQAQRAQSWQ